MNAEPQAQALVPSHFDMMLMRLLTDSSMAPMIARLYRLVMILCILGSTAIAIVATVPGVWGPFGALVSHAELLSLAVLTVDYALRLRLAWIGDEDERGWLSLAQYALGPYGLFDFLAVVPFLLIALPGMPADSDTIFGILRFLKLARYSPALETLAHAVLVELKPLASALFIVAILAIFAATGMYFVERTVNPNFQTVPDALWWAIITLTTVGYGDVVPITALGKILNAGVAVLGLCMFAMPASILANGFSEEMKRRDFLATWHLVAKVPLFAEFHAGQIAEISSLLRPMRVRRGEVVVREGEIGDSMFFIVSGSVRGTSPTGHFTLKAGDFFGEIAMVERVPRTATVTAATRAQLLVLDVRSFQRFVHYYPEILRTIQVAAKARMSTDPAAPPTTDWEF